MQLFDDENQEIQWLNSQDVQSILENLPRQPLLAGRSGLRATLPINAPVIPVILREGAVGLPCAGHLSTHILLRVGDRDTALRYSAAAALAGLMKLPCAPLLLRDAAGEGFVLYTRSDRINATTGTSALHLESLAQCALATEGQSPLPGTFERLRRQAHPPAPALLALLDQILFNTLIGNQLDDSDWALLDCGIGHCGLSPWMGFHLDDNQVALPWVDDKKRQKPASAAAWSSLADQAGLSRAQTRQRLIKRAAQFQSAIAGLDFAALCGEATPGISNWLQNLSARAGALRRQLS